MKTEKNIFNKQSEKEKRLALRKKATKAEQIIWNQLQNRKLSGFKFKRQFGINFYIADFYCPEKKLVIELDGEIHNRPDSMGYDKERDTFISGLGIKTVRFRNEEVHSDLGNVLKKIQ